MVGAARFRTGVVLRSYSCRSLVQANLIEYGTFKVQGQRTMTIGFDPAKIKDKRLKHLWSQEELARAAGLNVRTVQRAEAGAPASLETGRALAGALDVGISELLSDEPEARLSRWAVGGAFLSLAGIVIGAASAFYGIHTSYVDGSLTAVEAGITSGAVGVGTGSCFALLGIAWSGRYLRNFSKS